MMSNSGRGFPFYTGTSCLSWNDNNHVTRPRYAPMKKEHETTHRDVHVDVVEHRNHDGHLLASLCGIR